ncbi:MAG TPA: pyrroline-5-carboxylate reductase [Mobilitalea sp.]|nr:pyrroline-5-carboxylate reductase [Mobilitalea sp.]
MALFGFIGVGNMGYPLLKAAIKTFGCSEVVYTDASEKRRVEIMEETGVSSLTDNEAVVMGCKFLVLVVKPNIFPVVLQQIKNCVTKDHVVISMAAGIPLDTIRQGLTPEVRLVRAMPNTPAMVSKGMTGVCFNKYEFTEDEQNILDRFFTSYGKYEMFDEKLMNAVVCANGSSPAYVYMFIEALADSVVKYGIPRDKAYILAAQTVSGAAAMVLETGEHPGKLKDNVCSPGGTTIAAVTALEEHGFRNAIMKATDACYEKCTRL